MYSAVVHVLGVCVCLRGCAAQSFVFARLTFGIFFLSLIKLLPWNDASRVSANSSRFWPFCWTGALDRTSQCSHVRASWWWMALLPEAFKGQKGCLGEQTNLTVCALSSQMNKSHAQQLRSSCIGMHIHPTCIMHIIHAFYFTFNILAVSKRVGVLTKIYFQLSLAHMLSPVKIIH